MKKQITPKLKAHQCSLNFNRGANYLPTYLPTLAPTTVSTSRDSPGEVEEPRAASSRIQSSSCLASASALLEGVDQRNVKQFREAKRGGDFQWREDEK